MTVQAPSEVWKGNGLDVHLLFSQAGVATQILLKGDSEALLIDVGDGTLRDLRAIGLNLSILKGAVITHGHCDHMGGLWSLLGFYRIIARKDDFIIAIPKGSKEPEVIISKFIESYPETIPYEIKTFGVEDGTELNIGGFKIRAYGMVHRGSTRLGLGDKLPAVGYSIEYNGQRITYSGDTGYCENLEKLTKGADFALVEASWPEGPPPGHEEVHLSVEEARRAGSLAKAYKIIHLTSKSEAYLKEHPD